MPPQTLLIDADDTLWENNIYFERAIAGFISFLNHHEFTPEQVREVLNDVERECIVKHGYGLHSFAHALVYTFERLSPVPVTPALHAQIQAFAHTIELFKTTYRVRRATFEPGMYRNISGNMATALGVAAVALKIKNSVHHMLKHPRSRNRAVLGHMAHDEHRRSGLLREHDQLPRALTHL